MESEEIGGGLENGIGTMYKANCQGKEKFFTLLETLNSELPKKIESRMEEKR